MVKIFFSFRSNTTKSFIICLLTVIGIMTSSGITAPSFATTTYSIGNQHIDASAITVWNNFIAELGMKEKLSPPEFSRVYTLVHISIYDSLLAAGNKEGNITREKSFYVSSIAEAASNILIYLFPNDTDRITNLKYTQINKFQDHDNLMIEKGSILGDEVAKAVSDYAEKDNSDLVWNQTIPKVGSCIWNGTKPLNPTAGFWKTIILKSGSEIQPQKPETCDSEADLLDLKQTYEAWKQRTPEQIAAVHYWGDKPPPVIWNTILNEQIEKYNMSFFDASYASVYLNVGMYDGFVSCWYTKYDYWTARPFQRIANITAEIPTPNFPGYTSGHSVISTIAGRILGEIFPNEGDYFSKQATEAGLSRLWAGIHFKQDIVKGMNQGSKIAEKVIDDMHKSPHKFIYDS